MTRVFRQVIRTLGPAGAGQLVITLLPDEDTGMQPYQGLVALDQTNLARCLEDYFERSEQLDTRLFFAGGAEYESDVGVTGLLLQRLPNHAGITDTQRDAAQDAWETLTALAATVTDEELATLNARVLLHRLSMNTLHIAARQNAAVSVHMRSERTDNTLMMLGKEDLTALLIERGEITVDCEFCGMRYGYQQADVDRVVNRIDTLRRHPRVCVALIWGLKSFYTEASNICPDFCILDMANSAYLRRFRYPFCKII